jgi:hypothetical protein
MPHSNPFPIPSTQLYLYIIPPPTLLSRPLTRADFIDARKWFTGPKITVADVDLTEDQQAAIRAEGLEIEGVPRPDGSSDGDVGVAEKIHEKA